LTRIGPNIKNGCIANEANYRELHTTYGWRRNAIYRIDAGHAVILIWEGKERGADWFLSAPSAFDLERQLAAGSHYGKLADTVYGDDEGDKVLQHIWGRIGDYAVNYG
jgi:hypothetical protein